MRKLLVTMTFFGAIIVSSKAQDSKLDSVFAPKVVGVPPSDAYIGLSKMASGEIRHYNYGENKVDKSPYYISSFDNGFTWKRVDTDGTIEYADVKNQKTGEYIRLFSNQSGVYVIKSDNQTKSSVKKIDEEFSLMIKPPIFIRNGERIVVAAHRLNQKGAFTYTSDDNGESWRVSNHVIVPLHVKDGFHKGVRWNHGAVEPTVVELKDGRLWMIIRTSLDRHYQSFSSDGGLTWAEATPSSFYGTITMPTLHRLSDGRLLFFWTNTTPLPEMESANGVWDDVFTNRNVTHVAISEDDGKSWIGMRELFLDERRNALDFASVQGADKSVHQAQCIEVGNKVLVSIGQDFRHRKLVMFDPNWLYEKARTNTFENRLTDWSTFKYYKGIVGHCGYNRVEGGRLLKHSNLAGKEMLNIKYEKNDSLVCDNDGAVWNFPAAKSGEFTTNIKLPKESKNVSLILNDRWFNPSDTVAKYNSIYLLELNRDNLKINDDKWHSVRIEWKEGSDDAIFYVDNKKRGVLPLKNRSEHGISYAHFISGNIPDKTGIFIDSVQSTVK